MAICFLSTESQCIGKNSIFLSLGIHPENVMLEALGWEVALRLPRVSIWTFVPAGITGDFNPSTSSVIKEWRCPMANLQWAHMTPSPWVSPQCLSNFCPASARISSPRVYANVSKHHRVSLASFPPTLFCIGLQLKLGTGQDFLPHPLEREVSCHWTLPLPICRSTADNRISQQLPAPMKIMGQLLCKCWEPWRKFVSITLSGICYSWGNTHFLCSNGSKKTPCFKHTCLLSKELEGNSLS